jgi:3-oxoacyl-[acyl-carrier protein] reductase
MIIKRIVITGASSQIGQAIAQRLAAADAHLLLHCNRNEAALRSRIDAPGCACDILAADFTNPAELDRFCKTLGDVDVLVNAAASTKADLLPNLSDDDMARMIAVNIRALAVVCRAVVPSMMVKRRGVIINISSVAAQRGNRGQTVYAGTKGFVESFTRSLAAEYGGRGIRANCVAPGAIDAGSLKELLSYAEDEVKKSTSANRFGTPEDVAAAVAFLCGPEAAFINGACLQVNGGFLAGI